MEAQYTLEKYKGLKSRHTCPACNHKHEFARYVDLQGNYLAEHIGRCNRESKCGYHMKPKEYLQQLPTVANYCNKPQQVATPKAVEYVNPDVVKATLKGYEINTFVQYLYTILSPDQISSIIDSYGLGTTKDGSCIFWQVDDKGLVRTGKVIRYNPDGHRTKEQKPYFIHTKLQLQNIEQCLFGLHLVANSCSPVGLVESEKTAVIMAGKLPEYTWVATGGKTSSLLSKAISLKGKKVVCFPDSDAFDEWEEKLSPLGFKISQALDKYLTPEEKEQGLDLADFVQKAQSYLETLKDGRQIQMDGAGYPAEWNLNLSA